MSIAVELFDHWVALSIESSTVNWEPLAEVSFDVYPTCFVSAIEA